MSGKLRSRPSRQHGAAILLAMLTVSLVASLAAAALWQRHKVIEVETAERARVQASALLVGALDWARLILREDLRAGNTDHLAEPWAIGLEESRLSTFLAVDKDNSALLEGSNDVFLSGQITDLQARFNVNNLAEAGVYQPQGLATWLRLFEVLALPSIEAKTVAENLRLASTAQAANQSTQAVYLKVLRPQDLARMGLSAATAAKLQAHIAVLPTSTPSPININTASAAVLRAAVGGLDSAQAARLLERRAKEPFKTVAEAGDALGLPAALWPQAGLSVGSKFFEVVGRLRLHAFVTEERAVVQRESLSDIRILDRERLSRAPALELSNARSGAALLQSTD